MKRLYISCDMEGITGICSDRQRNMGDQLYDWGRKMMIWELNTALQLFAAQGVEEFVVNDSHNNMLNLLLDQLPPSVSLISGSHKTDSMMQGLDASFDGAVFIGYHGRAGLGDAILSHTYSGSILSVTINGIPAGEATLNGALCGSMGVPLLLVSGDNRVAEEVAAMQTGTQSVINKVSITRAAGRMFHPEKVAAAYKSAIDKVYSSTIQPFRLEAPFRLDLTLKEAQMVDMVLRIPGTQRSGDCSLQYGSDNYLTAFRAFLAIMSISSNNYLK